MKFNFVVSGMSVNSNGKGARLREVSCQLDSFIVHSYLTLQFPARPVALLGSLQSMLQMGPEVFDI